MLRNIYNVDDVTGKYSVGLCTDNDQCGDTSVSSCLITEDQSKALAGTSARTYYDDGVIKISSRNKASKQSGKYGMNIFKPQLIDISDCKFQTLEGIK